MTDRSITKANIIGYALTLLLSISGAAVAVNARVYELEKQLEIVKLDLENTKVKLNAQENTIDKLYEVTVRIDKNIIELTGELKLKADKQFK
jgi:hypothetical protein